MKADEWNSPVFGEIEAVKIGYDKWSSIYDHTIRPSSNPLDMYFQELEKGFILSSIKEGINVLDVGTGTGRLALVMAQQGAQVTGLDLSESMLAVARRKLALENLDRNVKFVQGSAHSLPFDENTFDLVTCTGVLGHVPVSLRTQAANEISRVLKRGGSLKIIEGNKLFEEVPLPGARADRLSSANPVDRDRDLITVGGLGERVEISWHRFYPRELTDLVSTSGLTVVELRGSLFFSAWFPKSLLRFFPAILRLARPFEDFLSVLPPFCYFGYRTFLRATKVANKYDW